MSPELEAELNRLGVRKPEAPKASEAKIYPEAWKPSFKGEQPPF